MLKYVIGGLFLMSSVILWAQEPVLVDDFHSGKEDAFNIANFKGITINDKMIFPISKDDIGEELGIVEDGNMRILRDLFPGSASSKPSSFVHFKGKTLFTANTPDHQGALWETDGTEGGTKMLFAPGDSPTHRPQGLIIDRTGILYFTYNKELYSYDGATFQKINAEISFTTEFSRQGVNYCRYRNGIAFTKKDGTDIKLFILQNGVATLRATLRGINSYGNTFAIAEVKSGIIFNYEYETSDDTGTYLYNSTDGSLKRLEVEGQLVLFTRIIPINENYAIGSSNELGTYSITGIESETVRLSQNSPAILPDEPWAYVSTEQNTIFNLTTDEGIEQYFISDGSPEGTSILFQSNRNRSSNIIISGSELYTSTGIDKDSKPHFHSSTYALRINTSLHKNETDVPDDNSILMLGVAQSKLYFSGLFDREIGRELYFIPLSSNDADEDGFVEGVDCDDNDPNINPDAKEVLDNDIDENCDGIVGLSDADQDGYDFTVDCDDNDPEINPGAEEISNNDIDENCDGAIAYTDNDLDGYNSSEDCDDNNDAIYPGAEEIPNNDIDEDCDGQLLVIDNDQDGYHSDDDCNDEDPNINGAAVEIPNNDIDEDCDGIALIIDNDKDGFHSDRDCDDNNPFIYPEAVEIVSNGIDEDCNGEDFSPFSLSIETYTVQIYPNPAYESLNINLTEGDGEMLLRVFSPNGKLFIEKQLNPFNNIDISTWPQGVLLVEILHLTSRKRAYVKQVKL